MTSKISIAATHERTGEVVCPHTACGLAVRERLRTEGDDRPWVVAATAHAAKFAEVVEPLVGAPPEVPAPLAELLARPSHAAPLEASLDALGAALAR